MSSLTHVAAWISRRSRTHQQTTSVREFANGQLRQEMWLDVAVLEDRVLYSATPLDATLQEGDAMIDSDVVSEFGEFEASFLTIESFVPPTEADTQHEVQGDDSDHEYFDLAGNEYHALPEPELLEVDSAGDSNDLLAAMSGLAPLTETFHLNSNAAAQHTIYLDFDGHTTTGTGWNSSFNGGLDIVTPAYDFDGAVTSFSTAELERIQYIWQRVAEDFSPFNVNVTTEVPTVGRLMNSGSGDDAWGVRVVVGGSGNDWYGSGAGGVAYRSSFSWSSDTPVFVFEANLGNGAEKYTAEAISHETGHALGLAHDGTSSATYYEGQGSGETGWAPIMGNSYYKNLSQWSHGEYLGATNAEDDLAVITTGNGFGYRVDDHGNGASGASMLTVVDAMATGTGIIERNTDVDVFAFTSDAGNIQLQVNPFVRGPNLDILAELYDASNHLIVSSNPTATLGTTLNATVSSGMYYLHVSGAGMGDPSNGGYSDYGSLGQYSIQGSLIPTNDTFVSLIGGGLQVVEGNSGATSFEFTVARSGNTSIGTTVDYQVTGISATAADFAGGAFPGGSLAFGVGEDLKTFRVDVAGDIEVEQNEMFAISLVSVSDGTQIIGDSATVTIVNDDQFATPGIRVSPTSGLSTKETGTSATFAVVLESRPTSDVVIQVASLDTTEGTVNKNQLTFTSSNWNSAQSVTVTGVDDLDRDGSVAYNVRLAAATSADPNYNGRDAADVSMTNQDNESTKSSGGGGKGGPRKAPVVDGGPSDGPTAPHRLGDVPWDVLVHRFVTDERFANTRAPDRVEFTPQPDTQDDEADALSPPARSPVGPSQTR